MQTGCFYPFVPMLLVFITGCSADLAKPGSQPVVKQQAVAYPLADAALGEKLYPNEQKIANAIALEIENTLRQQYSAGNARRDAHPKAHGCVKAEFKVMDNLPSQLAQGVFMPGKSYAAWIRFSNGSNDPTQADIKGDARGMAIKLMGVSGSSVLVRQGVNNEAAQTTQDFILSNHPVFFANDPERYLSFFKDFSSSNPLKKLLVPFALGSKGSLIAIQTIRSKIPNPLQTRYWSQVPYQLGVGQLGIGQLGAGQLRTDNPPQAVKYSVQSCTAIVDAIPQQPEHDYLRAALKRSLQHGDACMQFLVQPRTSTAMLVEDSMTEWKESKAPFYRVATIRIPKQQFDTPAQNAFCENLSFTPWHSLPEHKPLGAMNRLRKVIYEHISKVRHDMNLLSRAEPSP